MEDKKIKRHFDEYLKREGLDNSSKRARQGFDPSPQVRQHPRTPTQTRSLLIHSPAPPQPRAEGELVWDRRKGLRIPLPTPQQGVVPVCISHVNSSSKGCSLGKLCQYNHPASITEWHPSILADWETHVANTDGLSWHPTLGPQ
jgi:hypothetical protein